LVLEIPNAEAVSFVGADGHFGLFGITLLDRPEARAYHARFFSDPYDVGDYHPLPFYEARFAEHGRTSRLLHTPAPTRLAAPLLRGFRGYWRETRAQLPAPLRRSLQRRLAAYLGRLGATWALRHVDADADRRFALRYRPEFWTLAV